jgi:hypothetical protein
MLFLIRKKIFYAFNLIYILLLHVTIIGGRRGGGRRQPPLKICSCACDDFVFSVGTYFREPWDFSFYTRRISQGQRIPIWEIPQPS